MLAKRKKVALDTDEKKACVELQAVVYLNLAVSFHIEKNFQKAIENAKKSIQYNPTIKGYYRLGQSYKAVQNYEQAVEAFKNAVKLNVSDPNDIQTEMLQCENILRV